MNKLQELLKRCGCSVTITVNEHRDIYQTAAESLDDDPAPREVSPDVVARMIETDTIIRVHFYPDTPIGFYEIWHYDIDAALDQAINCLDERFGK